LYGASSSQKCNLAYTLLANSKITEKLLKIPSGKEVAKLRLITNQPDIISKVVSKAKSYLIAAIAS
jgi:hypothetical protein